MNYLGSLVLFGMVAACAASPPPPTPSTSSSSPVSPSPQPSDEESREIAPVESSGESAAIERDKDLSSPHFGTFVGYELVTGNPSRAAAFYEKLLVWTATPISDQGTLRFAVKNGNRHLASIREHVATSATPPGWMSWISVQDIDDMMRDVPANGGTVLVPPHPAKEGRIAQVKGPTGGIFGVIQLAGKVPPDASATPGDFVLAQLWTNDFDVARNFYSVMGDYTRTDVEYGTTKYTIMRSDGRAAALIRLAPSGQANRWIPFVLSADVDGLAKKAKALGATLITAPRDIPTLGRVAVIGVPDGGIIGFIRPVKSEPDSDDGDM